MAVAVEDDEVDSGAGGAGGGKTIDKSAKSKKHQKICRSQRFGAT